MTDHTQSVITYLKQHIEWMRGVRAKLVAARAANDGIDPVPGTASAIEEDLEEAQRLIAGLTQDDKARVANPALIVIGGFTFKGEWNGNRWLKDLIETLQSEDPEAGAKARKMVADVAGGWKPVLGKNARKTKKPAARYGGGIAGRV